MAPILLIHGFGGYNEQYQPIKKYLQKNGTDNFYEFNYNNKFGLSSIKAIAKELADFIDNNVKEESINIIGFSQGGIIALAYSKYFKNKVVESLFTVCSPHKGSKLAKIAKLPGFIDLQPNSVLLKDLENFSKENKASIYSVYTPFDLIVFPGWNARARYGKKKIVFSLSHNATFSCPATMRFIYKNIV